MGLAAGELHPQASLRCVRPYNLSHSCSAVNGRGVLIARALELERRTQRVSGAYLGLEQRVYAIISDVERVALAREVLGFQHDRECDRQAGDDH